MAPTLLLYLHGIGDNIMLTGVLKEYKEKHPDEDIDLVVLSPACAAVWKGNPLIRSIRIYPYVQPHFWNLLEFKLKSERRALRYARGLQLEKRYERVLFPTIQTLPELVYHLAGTYGAHKVPRIAKDLGLEPRAYLYDLYTSHEDRLRATVFREKAGGSPFAVLHPFAGHAKKQMSARSVTDTIRLLKERGLATVIVGSEQERSRMDSQWQVQSAFGWSFGELVELLKLARVFVGTDSAVAHLAGFANTPHIVVFSPKLKPARYAPLSASSRVDFIHTRRLSETDSIDLLQRLIGK
jgi:ADP-heptose:LPS heptosyltransferase